VVLSIPFLTPVHCSRHFSISHNSFSILSTKEDSDSDSDPDSDAAYIAHTISLESIAQQFIRIQQTMKQLRTEVLPGISIQVESNSHFNV